MANRFHTSNPQRRVTAAPTPSVGTSGGGKPSVATRTTSWRPKLSPSSGSMNRVGWRKVKQHPTGSI